MVDSMAPLSGTVTEKFPASSVYVMVPVGSTNTCWKGIGSSVSMSHSPSSSSGIYTANVCAVTSFDSRMLVFIGDCDNLTCAGGNDDFCGTSSRVQWAGSPIQWSYIYVTGAPGQTGAIQLQLICDDCEDADLYVNDECLGAIDILNGADEGSTCCAGGDTPNLCTLPGVTPQGVWYKANSGSYADLNFNLTNLSGTNVSLTVFEDQGGGCDDLEEKVCGGPVTGTVAGNLGGIFTLLADTDYYFYVNSQSLAACGHFSITVTGSGFAGCTDPEACNYNSLVSEDNGSCTYPGCMDPLACNYSEGYGCSDGSCWYPGEIYDCESHCYNDVDGDGVCDELEVIGCTVPWACNFDPNTTDEGECYFANSVFKCSGECQLDENNNGVCDQLETEVCYGQACCGDQTLWDPIQGVCLGEDDCPADINGDGVVDAVDILDLIGSYNVTCP